MLDAILGTFILACFVFLVLVYVTGWRLQLKDILTGGHEARDFWPD